jgi:hypothetical protein
MKRTPDIDEADLRTVVQAIRKERSVKKAIAVLAEFCERYRKNYSTRKGREKVTPERARSYCKKYYVANKEAISQRRREAYKQREETKWLNGERNKKPRWL